MSASFPPLGSHLSIAGGYYKAVEQARANTCDAVQIFTKNNNQWKAKPLTDDDVARFQAALAECSIGYPLAHNSYLINLAAPDDELWEKSIAAQVVELERAQRLGLIGVVAHPGAFTTSSEEAGLARIIRAFDEVHRRTPQVTVPTLLETTAGQGSCLGHRFEHLATIIAGVKNPNRLGVCVDTCHIFAAGYPLETKKEYEATVSELDKIIGLGNVKAFHLNDSKQPFGSRKDRHEHIGRGKLGLAPFKHLLSDARFEHVPMYLETAKEQENGVEMDVVNLQVLRGLVTKSKRTE
jgi:deoxyribonuclease-4